MTRVAFLVCHLSGSGHLARTLTLAKAVEAAGGAATAISGGRPLPHLDPGPARLVQLPPVAVAGLDYSRLTTPDGAPADDALTAARARRLAEALEEARPDVLVTELYPFGRRILSAEFDAAVVQARGMGARVLASVRDIPEPPRRPGRVAAAHAVLRAGYDGALVHGDPAVAPFALGWPGAAEIADLTRATGYVAAPQPEPVGDPDEVLVAEGGGALGRGLLSAAVEAARRDDGRTWRLRVGGADAAAAAAALTRLARGAPVIAEPAAPDFRARLRTCAAVVSRFGYNAAVEIAQAGAPAVACPLSDGGEREQGLRAAAFARLGIVETLDADDGPALLAAVRRARNKGRAAGPPPLDLRGAVVSARLLLG
ncbi:hypothetical protein [Rubrimonas cliftonensis]|uniref:Predicted glycosyl transferase n=1 Tax=Rubrimonas cliftonensis TaxID=89524 RepID=A0A1H4D5B9_9RHOB|nr:hypothetical protein [Rubrimonas cliftonensis]SEA67801.1 Predicted glycosyl transferase [Rubrimonas cliftonensis]